MKDWYLWKRDGAGHGSAEGLEATRSSPEWRDTTCKRGKTLQILPRVDGSTVRPRASETCQDQRGWVLEHVPSVRESLWIRTQRQCLDEMDPDGKDTPSDQTFEHCLLVDCSGGIQFKWKTQLQSRLKSVSLKFLLSQFQTCRGWWWVITVLTRIMATSRAGCITADSKPGHLGKLLRPLCGMRDAVNTWDDCCNIAAISKGTKLDSHQHACTYGSDVARSDGQKQVGPSPSSAVGPNTDEESASNEPPELSRETPPCRLYLVAQLVGVMRDGQWLPTVQLRGLISLVVSPVHGLVYGPRLSRFVLTSWVLEDTFTFLRWSFVPTCTRQPRVETRSCIGVEGEENWCDEVQKEWEGVMILKRCPKLEWRASDDKLLTIFNKLAHQQDNGGNQCVAPEPGPRRIDWLREACGRNAKARAVTTPGDKKLDNYDETLLNASEVGILLQQTSQCLWRAGLRDTSDAPGRWMDSTEDMCAMCSWKQSVHPIQKIRLDTSVNPIFITSSFIKNRPDEHHDSSHQADSSYEWWHMRCPTLTTWNVFYVCVFDPTSVHFEVETRKMTHSKTLDTKLAWESWSDNETNDQLLNNIRARSKYLHYSKIKDNLKLLHNLSLKIEHEHVIHISIKCVIDSTYFSKYQRQKRDLLEELRSHEQVF